MTVGAKILYKKNELGTGRVAFLARKEAIKERIEAGRTTMSVYKEFSSKIGISYGQFGNYVNRYIREKQVGTEDETPVTIAPLQTKREAIETMISAGKEMIKAHDECEERLLGSYALLITYVKEFIEWQDSIRVVTEINHKEQD